MRLRSLLAFCLAVALLAGCGIGTHVYSWNGKRIALQTVADIKSDTVHFMVIDVTNPNDHVTLESVRSASGPPPLYRRVQDEGELESSRTSMILGTPGGE